MDQYEVGEVVDCALCGCDVSLGLDCAYTTVESALCFSCAVCRGGIYDDAERMWRRPPDVSGCLRSTHAAQRSRKRYWRVSTPLPAFLQARAGATQ